MRCYRCGACPDTEYDPPSPDEPHLYQFNRLHICGECAVYLAKRALAWDKIGIEMAIYVEVLTTGKRRLTEPPKE